MPWFGICCVLLYQINVPLTTYVFGAYAFYYHTRIVFLLTFYAFGANVVHCHIKLTLLLTFHVLGKALSMTSYSVLRAGRGLIVEQGGAGGGVVVGGWERGWLDGGRGELECHLSLSISCKC